MPVKEKDQKLGFGIIADYSNLNNLYYMLCSQVNIDIINIGEEEVNTALLNKFIGK